MINNYFSLNFDKEDILVALVILLGIFFKHVQITQLLKLSCS